MILLIDNYDSFTYNLYQYLSELGAEVSVARNDRITVEEIRRKKPEAIVISPRSEDSCRSRDIGKRDKGILQVSADTRSMSRASGDRRGLRRTNRQGADTDARQDFSGITQR